MDHIYCTLFDSNYLDKGLVLYDSMCQVLPNFKLYVFAFDDLCYNVLSQEKKRNLIVIPLREFETPELLKVKAERTKAEYCWTCSPWIIKHVLENYHENICTYIDADMMFFSSPQTIFDEMREQNCSTIIVPHRFKTAKEEKKAHDRVGSYCVEFNTFLNNEQGLEILNWWAERCLEWCFYVVPGTAEWYGDQKYLNAFPELFDGVYICNHYGVGLAPWNIRLVEYVQNSGTVCPHIKVKSTDEVFPLVIYHYENVSFLSNHILHASSRTSSKDLRANIYDVYIDRIIKKRKNLKEKYHLVLQKKRRIVTKNPIIKIYQKYISPFRRVRHLSDLYWIKED